MKKILIIMALGILILLPGVFSHAGDDDFSHHDMMAGWNYNAGFFGMGFAGWIIVILIIIILILFIIWLIKQIENSNKKYRRGEK